MISDILAAAGITCRHARFPQPAADTYAVYTDDVSASGADNVNCIFAHSVTVELYEPAPDDAAEVALEEQLNTRGLPWDKQDRYWLQAEQRYQVIYEFDYVEKRRI